MAAPIVRTDRVTLDGRDIAFTLHRVPRRRQVHVLVNETGQLEVRAPWRFSLEEARVAIHEHGQWVLESLDACRTRVRMRPQLVTGARLPLLDEALRLRVAMNAQLGLFDDALTEPGATGQVVRRGRELSVAVRSLEPSAVRGLLERWYRRQAEALLPPRLARLAHALDVNYGKVTVRAQRTRWGSCSNRGAISLNWRLLLLPSRLCDYVLVHELCHIKEMNHSPAFWQHVASQVPDFRARRRELDSMTRALPL